MPRKPLPEPPADFMANLYVLDEAGAVQPATDFQQWARSRDDTRSVAVDQLGETTISTVFLGINMEWRHGRHGTPRAPLVFETMAFWPDGRRLIDRYTTRAKALKAHQAVVAALKNDMSLLDEI